MSSSRVIRGTMPPLAVAACLGMRRCFAEGLVLGKYYFGTTLAQLYFVNFAPPTTSLLVIEDDLSLIQVIDAMLAATKPGLEWEYVTSGEDALDLIARRGRERQGTPYRLVISDLFLEGDVTGFDVWRECQRIFPAMPFVMTSGLSIDRYRAAWKDAAHCPQFLAKPLTLDRYESVIGEYLA